MVLLASDHKELYPQNMFACSKEANRYVLRDTGSCVV